MPSKFVNYATYNKQSNTDTWIQREIFYIRNSALITIMISDDCGKCIDTMKIKVHRHNYNHIFAICFMVTFFTHIICNLSSVDSILRRNYFTMNKLISRYNDIYLYQMHFDNNMSLVFHVSVNLILFMILLFSIFKTNTVTENISIQ